MLSRMRLHADGEDAFVGELVSAGTEVDFIGRVVVERMVAASAIVQADDRTPILPSSE